MKMAEQIMDVMSMVDESYLKQSEEYGASRFAWKPFLSFAAVCALVFAVILNIPRSGSSSPAAGGNFAVNDSAEISEDAVYETENPAVFCDNELLDYLETLSGETEVTVWIEEVSETDEEIQAAGAKDAQNTGADPENVRTMTKAEILSFVPEEGRNYIFHLYTADDME